ncbi:MAG: hypothetical protein WC876_02435 [Candidatus Thermoplasmatota archaeon]|jgi:hypothetical protein
MSVRLVVAVVVLGGLAGGLWWTASLVPEGPTSSPDVFAAYVVGPGGGLVANGTVVAIGTPFEVLRALAESEGFDVEVEQQTWIGEGCTSAYVVGVAGHHESAHGGWNYYTRQPGESWAWGSVGAACHTLEPGDEVEWCWVEGDVCQHHVA